MPGTIPRLFGAVITTNESSEIDDVAWLGNPTTVILAEARSGTGMLQEQDLANFE